MNHKVEICTDTFKSVENAANTGATRIELCSALDLGGLTPSTSFARLALSKTNIKINVLIRPRPGNFVYSDDEFSIICQDIQIFKELGVNGIVCGVLTKNGDIDVARTKLLVELSKPLEFTFHRAFDNCRNKEKAINDVILTGANRILTSGFEKNVWEGMENIIELHKNYGHLIKIMPGGGIDKQNAKIFLENGIDEIHLSAGVFEIETNYTNIKLGGMGHQISGDKYGYKYSNIEIIQDIVNLKSTTK